MLFTSFCFYNRNSSIGSLEPRTGVTPLIGNPREAWNDQGFLAGNGAMLGRGIFRKAEFVDNAPRFLTRESSKYNSKQKTGVSIFSGGSAPKALAEKSKLKSLKEENIWVPFGRSSFA